MNKTPSPSSTKTSEPTVPADLLRALKAEPEVMAVWKGLTPLARRDWIGWVDTAKQAETRARRIEQVGSKIRDGKRRPCCYAVVPMALYQALGKNPKAKVAWSALDADKRRDVACWVESPENPADRKLRVAEVCDILANGKKLGLEQKS